jgi:hypothetical protein
MVFYNYFLHTSLFCFLLRIKYPKTKRLNWNHHLAKKNDKPLSFSNREWVILDEVPTMVEIEIFWFQIHITNGLNSLHRKWRTGNQYRVTAVEIRMRSNLELLPVMNVKKWLKIAVCSSPLNIYHGTDNIIKQLSEIIFSMKLRRRVPDYTTPDWVHSLHEGAGPRFGEKPLKTTENLSLGSPICLLFWESLDQPPVISGIFDIPSTCIKAISHEVDCIRLLYICHSLFLLLIDIPNGSDFPKPFSNTAIKYFLSMRHSRVV